MIAAGRFAGRRAVVTGGASGIGRGVAGRLAAEGVGYAGNDALRAPFTRAHFADALGITPVHLSRTLRRLGERGLVRWRDDSLVIVNRPELERIASWERVEGARRPLI